MASADTYPAGGSDFAADQQGWTNGTSYDGVCVPLVLCPQITNEHVAAGGAGGASDGYIRSRLTGLLSTVLATSNGTWESPAFTYNGNGGVTPTSATMTFSVLTEIQSLLVDVLNDSSVKVDLVDQTNMSAISVYPATTLRPPNDGVWTVHAGLAVDPAQLVIGRDYKVRITTAYHTVAALIPNGSVGFDDVSLTTAGDASGGGGGGGGGGGNGSGSGTGSGTGTGTGSGLTAEQQCVFNVKKKIKKKKLTAHKRKRLLKKKIADCHGKHVKKKKKVKKRH